MLKGLLHIGMPKCMSTSLQAYLHEAKNVHFAGIGPSKHVQAEMLLAFQRQIVRTPTQFYNASFVAKVFSENMARAREQGADIFALSDETIPFPLGYARADTSYVERLMRLKAVMPQPTTVLMIVRRPADLLKSTYKYRVVMNGVTFTYEEFLKRLLLLGDTNILGTLKFAHYAEAAKRIFGDVNVVAIEDIRRDERCVLQLLGAPDLDRPVTGRLPHENSGMPNAKFANFRTVANSLGGILDDDDFNVMSPADRLIATSDPHYASMVAGVLIKEQTLELMRTIAKNLPNTPPDICFEISDDTRRLLAEYLAPANAELRRQYDIPIGDYGYDLF
jgi:hypothetical protein